MITKEQLLESVDLDFEPRFVTKDMDGTINVWENKPGAYDDYYRVEAGRMMSFGPIKISEFENKDWQECIYEVPRKVDYTKYIGKVCKFWDHKGDGMHYGILTKIDDGTFYPFECNEEYDYQYCEPVCPDDNVIYKEE